MERAVSGLALLTDLDGTLLTPEKTLLPQDDTAIADFRQRGGKFSIATGRGIQATKEFLNRFQPDFPAVMYNGALIYDSRSGKTVRAVRLPEGIRAILEELMREFPQLGAEVLNESGVYVIQDGEYERRHLEITHVPLVFRSLNEAEPEGCLKALFAGAPEDISKLQEYVAQPRFSCLNFTRSHSWFLEILPQNTSKGTALTALRELLPPQTLIGATGDFDNDIPMLLCADLCGCPANAQESVKAAVAQKGGLISEKTCAEGFFADWIAFAEKRTEHRS